MSGGLRYRLIFVVGAAIVIVGTALVASVPAAPFGATASVSPTAQYLGDTAGTVLTFTIENTGPTNSIGAVEIRRPNSQWTVVGCPSAPTGWIAQRADTMCRYRSDNGTGDDIQPGETSSAFQVRAATAPGTDNRSGTWSVSVSRTSKFDSADVLAAAPSGAGALTVTAYTFEVLDAVVAGGPSTPGSACPPSNKAATAGSTRTIVVCGKNHATVALTPVAAQSSLGGTFLQSSGTFGSGSIAANSASSVVLANWTGARITSTQGSSFTVVVQIGASSTRTSPSTEFDGYQSVNLAPSAADDTASTNKNSAVVIDVLANDSDPENDPIHVASVNTSGTLGLVTITNGGADVTYDPNGQFAGLGNGQTATDTFTYKASDGVHDSNSATVTVTIQGSNTPPTATDVSYTGALGNTLFAVGATVTGEPVVSVSGTVLDGASDPDGPSLTAVAGTSSTANGGTVDMNADGTFTYLPLAGFTGDDTFGYTVQDGAGGTASATVTVTVSGPMIWYVDNSAASGGDGRSRSPYDSLAPLSSGSDPDAPGDIVFVYSGSGSYGGGLVLETDQLLVGQPAGLTVGSAELVPAGGTNPVITNAGGDGLTVASGVEVRRITVSGAAGNGIYGSNVSDVTIGQDKVLGSGDSAADHEAGIRFDNLLGASTIENTEVSGSIEDNVRIVNTSGSLSLTMSGLDVHDTNSASGNAGLTLEADGTAQVTAAVSNSSFTRNQSRGIQALANGSAALDLSVTNSTFVTNFVHVDLDVNGAADLTFDVGDNTTTMGTDGGSTAINVFLGGGSTAGASLSGTISGNQVTNTHPSAGPGIAVNATGAGSIRVGVTNNTVNTVNNRGIDLEATTGSANLDATVTGNTVHLSGPSSFDRAIFVQSGALGGDTTAVCADLTGNDATSGTAEGIRVRNRFSGTVFRLPGYPDAATVDALVAAFIEVNNIGTTATASHGSSAGFSGGGGCLAP